MRTRISSPTASAAAPVRRRTWSGVATLRANRMTPHGRAERKREASSGASSSPARPMMNADSMRGCSREAAIASVLRDPAVLVAGSLELAADAGCRLTRPRGAHDQTVHGAEAPRALIGLLHVWSLAGEH